MKTTARRAAASGAMAALLTAAGAISGFGSADASAYSLTAETGMVGVFLDAAEVKQASTITVQGQYPEFARQVCSDTALTWAWSLNGITVTNANCVGYVYSCSADARAEGGVKVTFGRERIACWW